MELIRLIFGLVLYTLVVAVVVIMVLRFMRRRRSRIASDGPIPKRAEVNSATVKERETPSPPSLPQVEAEAETGSREPALHTAAVGSGSPPLDVIEDESAILVPRYDGGDVQAPAVERVAELTDRPRSRVAVRNRQVRSSTNGFAVNVPTIRSPEERRGSALAAVARVEELVVMELVSSPALPSGGEGLNPAAEFHAEETDVPATEPPTTEAPATEAPTTKASATEQPTIEAIEAIAATPLAPNEPELELDVAPSSVPAISEASPVDPLGAVFFAGGLLPEGLRTLEVTPNRVIEPGMTVRAAFVLRNPGGGTARGFRALFRLPPGLVYSAASARVDDTPLAEQNGQSALLLPLGADIGDIPPGGERCVSLGFSVAERIESGTVVQLQAAVASADVPVIGSNIVALRVHSRPSLQNPLTTLALEAVRAALPGEELQLTARVYNSGQSSALDLIVLLPIPGNTTFSPQSVTVDGRPFVSALPRDAFGSGRPTIVTPALAPGATVEVGYRVRIDTPLEDATRIVAHGTACAQEVAEFALPSVSVEIPSSASFDDGETSFRAECADEVEPGERLRIALRAKNVGTSTARDFSLAIMLPDGMVYSAGSLAIDDALAPDHGTAPGVLRLGDLGPGRAVALMLTAIVQSPAANGNKLRLAAQVRWSKGERSFGRDLIVRSAPRFAADFNRIERESAERVAPGDAVSYTIALANMGTDVATAVRLKLTADAGLEAIYVRNGDARISLAEDLTVPLETLEPGVSLLLRVTGRVAGIVEDQKELRLQAELQTAQISSFALGSQVHVVQSRPKFSVATSRIIVDSAQQMRFKRVNQCRLLLVNEGTDRARDVRVSLLLPNELRLEGVDNATREGESVAFGDIPAGEKREAVVYLRLVGMADGEPLSISARVAGPNVVPVSLTSVQLATHSEASFAEAATLTSLPAQTVDAGAEIAYTLSLRNSGDGPAKQLAARLALLTNAGYAQGSTSVNGIALQDHGGTSLLLSEPGLRFADVGPGVEIVASWRAIVHVPLPPGTTIESAAAIRWDDAAELTVAAPPLVAQSTSALPIIDPELPFSMLDAIAAR